MRPLLGIGYSCCKHLLLFHGKWLSDRGIEGFACPKIAPKRTKRRDSNAFFLTLLICVGRN
jgi:hypothetical protein